MLEAGDEQLAHTPHSIRNGRVKAYHRRAEAAKGRGMRGA